MVATRPVSSTPRSAAPPLHHRRAACNSDDGTDINGAVGDCHSLIREPRNTIFVLISDLYEGGVEAQLLKRALKLTESGAQFITLLALSDEGAPAYDHTPAAKLAALGVLSFACTPDAFPGLMAASRGMVVSAKGQ